MRGLALLLMLGLAAGCARALPGGSPRPAPAAAVGLPAFVPAVRRLERGGRRAEALALLGTSRGLSVYEPERSWLLVALWIYDCGRARARQAVARLPPADITFALRALADEDPEAARQRLRARCSCCQPGWRHLALAHLGARVGDQDATLAAAGRALASRFVFVRQEAHLLRSAVWMQQGRLPEAAQAARAAAALDPQDGRPLRRLAEIERRRGELDAAARLRIQTLALAADSEAYVRPLADLLREGVSDDTWAGLTRALAGLADSVRPNPELTALRGLAAEHRDALPEAIAWYRQALREGALPVPVDRDLRRLLMGRGHYREALALLFDAVPPEVLDDPLNLRRPHWIRLRRAAARAPSPAASPADRHELAEALVGVGALPEARAALAGLGEAPARALDERIARHLAFEAALRADVEAGYRTALRQEDPATFEAVLQRVRVLARTHLAAEEWGPIVRSRRGLRDVPVVGAWLDHSTDTTSPLVAHFRRYGRLLVLGQRRGEAPEAIVLSLASLTRAQPIRSAGRAYRHDVAIGYDRALRASIAAEGGELGGACLPDGIWLDADSARRSESDVRRALLRDPSFLSVVRASGALAADTLDGPYALGDPGCTAARLLARYVARRGDDPWGSYRTLRAHEFGHLYDLRRHLPILRGLPATLELLLSHGFSAHGVESDLERRAQLVACIDAPDPDLALAEMLLALPLTERDPPVHDAGYRDGLQALVLHVAAHPERYPRIDPTRRILTQLDRLSNAEIRAAARAVACR